jgi:hypothetical protein
MYQRASHGGSVSQQARLAGVQLGQHGSQLGRRLQRAAPATAAAAVDTHNKRQHMRRSRVEFASGNKGRGMYQSASHGGSVSQQARLARVQLGQHGS